MKPPSKKLSPKEWNDLNLKQGHLPTTEFPDLEKRLATGKWYPDFYNPKTYKKTPEGGFMNVNYPDSKWGEENFGEPFIQYNNEGGSSNNTALEPAVQVAPGHKSLQMGPNVTYNPNTAGYQDSRTQEKVEPVVNQRLKKGGIIGKYLDGGNITSVTGQATDLFDTAATAGSTLIAGSNNLDEEGHIDVNKAKWAGALGTAGKGAKMGAAAGSIFGPLGGAIGAGVGALGGGAIGLIKGKKDAEAANAEVDRLKAADEAEELAAKGRASVSSALAQRATENLNKGGKITGKGSSKSDSIPAKVDGFVVPAENAQVAETIRKFVLRDKPNKKADLNQSGGHKVKVSNGEHLFTDVEVSEITAKGIDLDSLAPEAKTKLRDEMNTPGYQDGGKTVKSKKATNNYYDSQEDSTAFSRYPKANTSAISQKYLIDPRDVPSAEEVDASKRYLIDPSEVPSASELYPKQSSTSRVAAQAVTANANGLVSSEMMKLRPSIEGDASEGSAYVVPQPQQGDTITGSAPTIDTAWKGSGGAGSAVSEPVPKTNWMGALGDVVNYGLPLVQSYLGNKMLQKAGPRPVDKLDPEYQGSIDAARKNLAVNEANAKFGYTAEEQAMINQDNANAMSQGRSSARNYSGGSAATAYNLERNAINDGFTRGLAAKVRDKQLQLQKQGIAQNSRAYLDELIAGNTNYKRNLYKDADTRWMDTQNAGANLLSAGITNGVGAGRYNAELEAQKQRDLKYGR